MRAQYESQLIYRKLDDDGSTVFGHNAQDFLTGLEAMTQVIKTRLRTVWGEWWEGDETAVPYYTEVMGAYATESNRATIDMMITRRILDTVGVLSVQDVKSYISGRDYHYSCAVNTIYGKTSAEVKL